MTIVLYTVGILLMVVGLGVSIALHEIGHLVPAKAFGVRVTQYMIGFGPTLVSRTRGETEYGIKAIPLGGYIRMIGMFPPHHGDAPGTIREDSTGFVQQMSDEAKIWEASQYSPDEQHRTFVALSVWKKLVVMLGGPFMNALLSVVLLAVAWCAVGAPTMTSEIRTVSQCVLAADAPPGSSCEGAPQTPAAAAGIIPGDVVTAINGVPVSTFNELSMLVRQMPNQDVRITVEREGESLELNAHIMSNTVVALDDTGRIMIDDNGEPVFEQAGFLGVSGTPGMQRAPLTEVPHRAWEAFVGTARVVVMLPVRLWEIAVVVLSDAERDPNGPLGVVGVSRLAGEVVSADATRLDVAEKAWMFLTILASLNMALFVFNLIPLLPLDGGHVLGALIEGARTLVARLRGRPDPGPIDMSRMLPVTNAVAGLFIIMSVLLLYADIVEPIRLFR